MSMIKPIVIHLFSSVAKAVQAVSVPLFQICTATLRQSSVPVMRGQTWGECITARESLLTAARSCTAMGVISHAWRSVVWVRVLQVSSVVLEDLIPTRIEGAALGPKGQRTLLLFVVLEWCSLLPGMFSFGHLVWHLYCWYITQPHTEQYSGVQLVSCTGTPYCTLYRVLLICSCKTRCNSPPFTYLLYCSQGTSETKFKTK